MYFKILSFCAVLAYLSTNVSCQTLGRCGPYCPSGLLPSSNNPVFKVLATFNGIDKCGNRYQKTFYYPISISATWMQAKAICQKYNLELASFKTLSEANAIITVVDRNPDLGPRDNLWIFINGIAMSARSPTDWYWVDSGEKIDFVMPWLPTQPDTNGGIEWYLSIGKHKKEQRTGFNDIPGSNFVNTFLCQRCS